MIQVLITSSVLIAVITLLRLLLRGHIRPGLQYALWGLVLLRLLVPGTWFHSPASVIRAVAPAIQQVESISVRPVTELPAYFMPAPPAEPVTAAMPGFWDQISLESLAIGIWITGAVLLGIWFAFVNLRLAAKLYRERRLYSTDYPTAVYVVESLPSPCLFAGEVYLTEEAAADPTRAEYIIAHELTHRRHGDGLWSALRVCCLAVYWFNPFVWLAASLSRRDCEIFCDAATVNKLGEEHRFNYGRTLLDMTTVKLSPSDLICSATTMSGSGRTLRERIRLIARQPKISAILCAVAVLIAAVAVGCTFSGVRSLAQESAAMPEPTATSEPAWAPVYGSVTAANRQDEQVNSLMENELYLYYMEYLGALGADTWDKAAEFCWMDSETSKALSTEHHRPITFASMIAFQHLSDDLIAILTDLQYDDRRISQALNFVGRVDGKPCIFRNADNIPDELREGLQHLMLEPDRGEEEAMTVNGSYYDEVAEVFGPFLEPVNVDVFLSSIYTPQETGDLTLEEFVYMTDSWDFRHHAPSEGLGIASPDRARIRITAANGRELSIGTDTGLLIYEEDAIVTEIFLDNVTGEEFFDRLYKWALGEATPTPEPEKIPVEEAAAPVFSAPETTRPDPTAAPTPTPNAIPVPAPDITEKLPVVPYAPIDSTISSAPAVASATDIQRPQISTPSDLEEA